MHSSTNHTDVQGVCLEVLGNYHKFELVCKHLFPYFIENCNFSLQVSSLVRRNFSPTWHLVPLAAAFMREGYKSGRVWPWPCKGYREIEDIVPALCIREAAWLRNQLNHQAVSWKVNCLWCSQAWYEFSLHLWPLQVVSLSVGLLARLKNRGADTSFTILLGLNVAL